MCMEIDGYIVGIGGVALKDGRWFAFTDLADEARERKIVLGRAAKRFFQDLKRDGIANVFAEKNNSEATAERWLASLGFEQVNGNVYRWRG